jgi:hypothetical protein
MKTVFSQEYVNLMWVCAFFEEGDQDSTRGGGADKTLAL